MMLAGSTAPEGRADDREPIPTDDEVARQLRYP
ncbi:hypothetical protein MGAST_07620 [Mycobacterium gastri 'Wayne']|nr:hypothetical protein MGAST_07620 [Mycobacterium gastri 'Wayne']